MGASTIKPVEAEEARQQLVSEIAAELGPDWAEPYKPGSFGCHELLDRTALATNTVEEFILAHPACIQNAEWYALAEQAAAALRELYQRVGADHMNDEGAAPPA